MKKSGVIILMIIIGLVLVGCASSPVTKHYLTDAPYVVMSEINGDSVKTHSITSQVYFGYFGKTTYPSAASVAQAGGITKIATVEYYRAPGILNIWTEYTTIVTGQ